MTVYNVGEIYLEDLSGGTSDQLHIYAQTDNIADGAITDAKLASGLSIDTYLSRIHPVVQHFYYEGKEPYLDTVNRTLTFHARCPLFVQGLAYNSTKATDTTIQLPESDAYHTLYLDLANSSRGAIAFVWMTNNDTPLADKNLAYVLQIRPDTGNVSAPFNVNIDGTIKYAHGKDVRAHERALTTRVSYEKNSGGFIRSYDGTVGNNANTGYTSYVDMSTFVDYVFCPIDHLNETYQMAFYDADKVYISGERSSAVPTATVWKIPIPEGAKYARFSYYLDVADTFYVEGLIHVSTYVENELGKFDKLRGKKLGIVGDSISTYQGYIPSGYATFYPRNTVDSVDKTWWKQLLDDTGMELCVNASWSGSTITGDTTRTDGYVGCSDARVAALTDGDGNTPDVIICWIGINDFGKSNGRTCGSYDGTTAVSTATSITAITEAYGVLISKLQTAYPLAQIFVCRILPEQFASEMSASYANGFPNINPDDNVSLPELNEHIEKIADAFGCGVIPMDKSGVTFFNLSTYTGDNLHPNATLTPKLCEVARQTLMQLVRE